MVRLTLWSRDRNDDVPQAVVSHESALILHGLTDLFPNRTHLTVPPGFRKKAPPLVVLHKGTSSRPKRPRMRNRLPGHQGAAVSDRLGRAYSR